MKPELFNTTSELKTLAMSAPEAVQVEVAHTQPGYDSTVPTDNYIGVWNKTTSHLSCVASRRYGIVQHRDVLEAFADTLQEVGLNIRGGIHYDEKGDEMRVQVFFQDEEKLIKDDAKGIQLGVRLINSYNLTNSLRGEMWGLRLVCSNGMKLPGFEAVYRRNHMGVIDVKKGMTDFVKTIIERRPVIEKLVMKNIEETLEYELSVKVFQKLFEVKKHRKILLNKLEAYKGKRFTKWELYNMVTNYATHGQGLRISAIDWLQDKARKLLTQPIEVLIHE